MPQPTKNAPDMLDVENMCAALGETYHVVVYFTTRIRNQKVELIGKTHGVPYTQEAKVEHVALASWPIQMRKDIPTAMYTVAFDLWCQHDGGGATAAERGAPYGWNGRVEVPTGRRRH
jgi:hypothetical protein